jgi:signal transduction histidine kinase
LEAMGAHGPSGRAGGDRITLSYGALGPSAAPARLRELFGGGEGFFAAYGGYILVEDTGTGMDKAFVQRRLFQPFATTKEKGVGIGLYQCKTLVEKMGGRILCHSELGKGTEFCILLPMAPAAAADPEA